MNKKRNTAALKGKRMMNKKFMWVAANIFVIAFILALAQLNLLEYPSAGMKTRSTEINFAWIGMSPVQIDENSDFTSPQIVTMQHPVVHLEPGTYYWKSGLSQVRSFVIDSEVAVAVTPSVIGNTNASRIENQGNTRIFLGILNAMTGKIVLEPQAVTYEQNVSSSDKIVAEEYGK